LKRATEVFTLAIEAIQRRRFVGEERQHEQRAVGREDDGERHAAHLVGRDDRDLADALGVVRGGALLRPIERDRQDVAALERQLARFVVRHLRVRGRFRHRGGSGGPRIRRGEG
jgi:hypothetical protein